MAASLGSLVVSLGLDATQFTSGLTKTEYQLQQLNRSVTGFAANASNALKLLGVGISVTAIAAFAEKLVETAERMKNLAADTGSTVEELSRLSNIAKISGTSFDTFQTAMLRLAAGLNGSEELSTKTADALKYLGVTAKDPATALQEIADKLNKYADGASKAAIARDLFGRGGAAFLSTLKAIAENQDQVNTLTQKQALETAALAEAFRTLEVNSHQVADAFYNVIIPSVSQLVAEFANAIKLSGSLYEALKLFATINPFGGVGDQIKDINQRIAAEQANVDTKGAEHFWSTVIGPQFAKESVDNSLAQIAKLKDARTVLQRTQLDLLAPTFGIDANKDARDLQLKKPDLGYVSGKAGAQNDAAKQILNAQLAELEAFIRSEQETLNQREAFLQDYYQHDELGIAAYFKARQEAIAEALAKEEQAFAKEEQLIKARIALAPPTERAEDERKLTEVIAKRAKAEQDAAASSVKAFIDQSRAAQQFQTSIEQIVVQVTALRGQTVEAAAFGFDLQNQQLIKQIALERESNDERIRGIAEIGSKYIDELRERTIEQAKLNDAQLKYSNVLDLVGVKLARVDLEQQTGALTEIDAINKKAAIAAQNIGLLTDKIAFYEKIAAEAGEGPIKDQALLNVERMKLQIDQLAASADVLAKKFDDIFSNAVADGITNIVNGTKSLRQAIQDVEKQIVTSLSRIAAQQLTDSFFSKSGPGGGIGDFLAKYVFGGSGSSSISGSGVGTSGLFDLLSGFGFSPFGFAAGGSPPVGKASIVGENGPELFIPKTSGTIIPNSVLESRRAERNITLNFYAPPGMNKQTAHQAALEMSRTLNVAQRINR